MQKNWKVTITKKNVSVISGQEYTFSDKFNLHCIDLEEAQGIINALESTWPEDECPLEVTIEKIIQKTEEDTTTPDTDFMEGDES